VGTEELISTAKYKRRKTKIQAQTPVFEICGFSTMNQERAADLQNRSDGIRWSAPRGGKSRLVMEEYQGLSTRGGAER
jgi:hypothetical protein